MIIPYDAAKLAKLTGTPVDTVKSAMVYLQQGGLIKFLDTGEIYMNQVENMIGSQSISAFKKQQQRMLREKKTAELLGKGENRQALPQGGQTVDTMVDNCPPEIEIELEKEIEKEREIEKETPAEASDPVPYSRIQKLFNETCKSFPKVLKISEARKKAIKARWIEYDRNPEVFIKLFTMTEASSFLKGKNERNWSATFDWLMNSTNMAKVLEGNYIDKGDHNNANGRATMGTGASTEGDQQATRAITTAELEKKLRDEGSFKGYPDFDKMFSERRTGITERHDDDHHIE